MAWKYILFDLDGTLTDSSEGIVRCVRYALEAAGREIPDYKTLLRFIGPPLVEGFQEVTGMRYEDAIVSVAKYRERYNIIGLFENKPYDGIASVLDKLKRQGKVLAVATSKPENIAVRILQHFRLLSYFTVVVGSTLDGRRDSKQAVIEEALLQLQITEEQKKEVIMVGDRKHDILGARANGITSLGVYYGFAETGELEAAKADHIVWSVEESLKLLAGEEAKDNEKQDFVTQ